MAEIMNLFRISKNKLFEVQNTIKGSNKKVIKFLLSFAYILFQPIWGQ